MTLVVLLQDGRRETIPVPDTTTEENYLQAFVRNGEPFNRLDWVCLTTGEYVRKAFVVSIKVANPQPLMERR